MADAFVNLGAQGRGFAQGIDQDDGSIGVAGSTSGAIAVAALVEAYYAFDDQRYLETAESVMAFYDEHYLQRVSLVAGPRRHAGTR